jgi:hypothetical protein
MSPCPVPRIVRIIEGLRGDLESHASTCGDRPVGVALSPADHAELRVAEIWGLPVLAWAEIEPGHYKLLCEAEGILIPHIDTFEELADRWAYHLQRPVSEPG